MLDKTKQAILAGFTEHPVGATAKELAETLGWHPTRTSQRLGILFFAGLLDRAEVTHSSRRFEYRYWVKPKTSEAPLQWKGEMRIAARVTEEAKS
jgi:predicted transcriptional regulator